MEFDDMPRVHQREKLVHQAEMKLNGTLLEVVHDLTEGEQIKVVTKVLSDWLLGMAKYMIRDERHPGEPDKPGGLE